VLNQSPLEPTGPATPRANQRNRFIDSTGLTKKQGSRFVRCLLNYSLRQASSLLLVGTSLLLSGSAIAEKIDVNAPADKERLIREISTSSPPRETWEHLSLVLNWGRGKPYNDTIGILEDYLKGLPPPTGEELAKFKDKLRGELVFVKGGQFLMGDFGPQFSQEKLPYSADDGAAPAHNVELASYSVLKHRVTFADFDLYTRANHLPPIGVREAYDLQFRFPDFPAAFVTWQQSRDFCKWAGEVTGMPLDVPTEAQWEYAARSRGEMWVIPSTEVQVVDGKYTSHRWTI
jgi:formylglycine-generating enzyme required for sulfatase activity